MIFWVRVCRSLWNNFFSFFSYKNCGPWLKNLYASNKLLIFFLSFFYIIIKIFFNDLQLIWHHIAITVLCHQNAYNKPSSPLRRHEKWRHQHQRRWRQHGGQIPLHLRQIVSCKISCMLPHVLIFLLLELYKHVCYKVNSSPVSGLNYYMILYVRRRLSGDGDFDVIVSGLSLVISPPIRKFKWNIVN